MKSLTKSRSLRGNALPSPVESPAREREPFYLGPFRQPKASLPSTPTRSRVRANGENVPPDNNHSAATVAYVKANMPTPDTASPAQQRSSKKGRSGGPVPLPGSPALLPRPPSAKPSPGGPKVELQSQDSLGPAKRKLYWDVSSSPAADTVRFAAVADTTGSDSGVKVFLRMRPLNDKEEQEAATKVVQKISFDAVQLGDQQFTYDAIAGEEASQEGVFEMVGVPMVENCLAGFNSSIFAYGQTGSGKTHTMMGVATDLDSSSPPSDKRGLTRRVIERLFSRMQQEEKIHADGGLTYQCRCSFLEIYNEQITDLLEPTQRNLQIREDTKTGVYVDSLTEEFVSNVDDVTRLLLKGFTNRRTGATNMNNESSRSHSVFTCVIESRFKNVAEGENVVRSSRMNLVDLAGSERQKQSGVAGERLKEAGNINKSLSQLGNVINILAEVAQTGKQRHIPYRDSRLTFLLQESLGGNAKLAMICAVSPASSCRSETLSTLRFAQRAKAIQNKAVVNEESSNDVGLLHQQIRQLKDELMRMKANGNQNSAGAGYSNSWNARRSYNLLRLSLSHPMTLSAPDLEDTDLEMEVEEDVKEPETETLQSAVAKNDSPKHGFARLPVIDEKDMHLEITSSNTSELGVADPAAHEVLLKASPNKIGHDVDDDIVNFTSESTQSPEKVATPEVMKIPESRVLRALQSPPESVSPRFIGMPNRVSSGSPRPHGRVTNFPPANSTCEEIYHSTQERFCDGTSTSESLQLNNDAMRQSTLRASISTARPTEKLAACLQRGLQILDSHQRSSISVRRSSVGLRSSVHVNDFHLPRMVEKVDKGVQTSPAVLVSTITARMAQFASQPAVEPVSSCELVELSRSSSSPDFPFRGSNEGELQLCTETQGKTLEDSRDDNQCASTGSPREMGKDSEERSGSTAASFQPSIITQEDLDQQPEDGHGSLFLTGSVREFQNGYPQLSLSSHPFRGFSDEPDHPSVNGIPPSSHATPTDTAPKERDTSNWHLATVDAPTSHTDSPQLQEVVEALLTGAIRRERVAEEAMSKQAAEIEQLNRLVRQYKHERECNAILHQSREDKIARLESLMDNVIPTDAYLNEEWSSLLLEYKMLQEKFDNHPEVTQSRVEQQRLVDELNQYREFFDMGEREILVEEIKQLRNQVQTLLENYPTNPSTLGRQKRLSLARISVQTLKHAAVGTECPSPSSLSLFPTPLEGPLVEAPSKTSSRLSMVVTGATSPLLLWEDEEVEGVSNRSQYWDEEKREMELDWEERERDWMAVLEELREEAESHKRQAERRKQELDGEKRCSDEMQDALQMAMTGHARLLEQYAELQEKHIILLSKHRKIKEGTVDVKKMAKKAGVTSLESRWLDAQALQIAALKVELEEESRTFKEEIEELKTQLQDTADAVQAAGELLVRLKEAEESVIIAQDAAVLAEQDAGALRREMEKVRRRHATEVATLQQRVLESRLHRTAVCPMCVMAERVKFQFTDVDAETTRDALETENAVKGGQERMDLQMQDVLAENQSKHDQSPEEGHSLSRQHHLRDGSSVWTKELEDQVGCASQDEFDVTDEIDHFFMRS